MSGDLASSHWRPARTPFARVRGAPASALLALCVLSGCGKPATVTWIEGFGFGWKAFNHRLSYVSYRLSEDAVEVGIVGGTSTTGVSEPLPDGCDDDTCDEFPFTDEAEITVPWATAELSGVASGTASVELDTGVEGAVHTLEVPLDRKARGEGIAVVRGFALDTDRPLSGGDACYRPEYGWHPRRFAVSLGEPVLVDGKKAATVEVRTSFVPGPSLEAERACIDEVVEQAVVGITVDVLVLYGKGGIAAQDVSHALSYTYGDGPLDPDPQPDPDDAERTLDLGIPDVCAGWGAFEFAFHEEDPQGRGAYLRTLDVSADPIGGSASGHATNYSPGTQLSAFDYAFSGTVRGLGCGSPPERGEVRETVEVELDAEGRPVLQTIAL